MSSFCECGLLSVAKLSVIDFCGNQDIEDFTKKQIKGILLTSKSGGGTLNLENKFEARIATCLLQNKGRDLPQEGRLINPVGGLCAFVRVLLC